MVGDKSCSSFYSSPYHFATSTFCNHQSVPTTRRPHNRGNCKGDCKSKSGWGVTVAGVGPTKDFICGLQSHVKDPCSTKLTPSFAATFFFSFRAFFAPTRPPLSATSGMTQETLWAGLRNSPQRLIRVSKQSLKFATIRGVQGLPSVTKSSPLR
jgi:hypothetical protein